ncbi:uncharacterized protein MONBRDRAFT_34791 [Monosiga brevicollis MX1]|uniref:Hormone-sensitive lipase n=1 Tax=Monosiga brevicollis TaxID=81824 RepID=A9VE33_MONBE|nr:uncharacterized protein MONBRDRAFT_34791 [Monosiga brevicollis MX1]EDQ84195.1 predicted protein [Monosiga brevicollis MX1]|eukprot:XP_001750983.1 hypothetical protein [Monosiga brevicollis MX1]
MLQEEEEEVLPLSPEGHELPAPESSSAPADAKPLSPSVLPLPPTASRMPGAAPEATPPPRSQAPKSLPSTVGVQDWAATEHAWLGRAFILVNSGCIDNINHFTQHPIRTNKICHALKATHSELVELEPRCYRLAAVVSDYDIHPEFKHNGFRSILLSVWKCLRQLQEALARCAQERSSYFFLSFDAVYEQIEDFGARMLSKFNVLLELTLELQAILPAREQFVTIEGNATAEHIFRCGQSVDVTCFYGARAGFHYESGIQHLMKAILTAMASFSDAYHSTEDNQFVKGLSSAWSAVKYALDPEVKAQRLVEQMRRRNPAFVKSFWNLTDSTLARNMSKIALPSIAVNRVLFIIGSNLVHDIPDGRLIISPPIVGRLGECRHRHGETQPISPDYASFLRRAYHELFAAMDPHELHQVGQRVRERLRRLPISPAEREALESTLYQMFELAKRQQAAATISGAPTSAQTASTQPAARQDDTVGELVQEESVLNHDVTNELDRRDTDAAASQAGAASDATAKADADDLPALVLDSRDVEDMPETSPDEVGDVAVSIFTKAHVGSRVPSVSFKPPEESAFQGIPRFGAIQVRLLCAKKYTGQATPSKKGAAKHAIPVVEDTNIAPAKGLLVHFHGGGFLSNSSKSHEVYLRNWARDLDVPILSVDYSLAPEAQFPRAAEECFYAYVWALEHASLLGTTADRVLVAGDSAGGNLAVSVALRCLVEGARAPDAIYAFYPVLNVKLALSSSRMLASFDCLLSQGVLETCLIGYVGKQDKSVQDNPFLSPFRATDSLLARIPVTYLVGLAMDPLLDDTLAFASRLKAVGARHCVSVLGDIPHGCLNFKDLTRQTKAAYQHCLSLLREGLEDTAPAEKPEWRTYRKPLPPQPTRGRTADRSAEPTMVLHGGGGNTHVGSNSIHTVAPPPQPSSGK